MLVFENFVTTRHTFHAVLLITVSCTRVMSDIFDSDSSPEVWVPALTVESSPVDFGFEQEILDRSPQDLVSQLDQQLTLSPSGLSVRQLSESESLPRQEYVTLSFTVQILILSSSSNADHNSLALSFIPTVATDPVHGPTAEPMQDREVLPAHGIDMEPDVSHTELSPLSDSLSLLAPSPPLPRSYVPPVQSLSLKATSESPGVAPSPRLPFEQVRL